MRMQERNADVGMLTTRICSARGERSSSAVRETFEMLLRNSFTVSFLVFDTRRLCAHLLHSRAKGIDEVVN